MKLVLSSMFRNSTRHLDRYFTQVNALRESNDVKLVLAEGDSGDNTFEELGRRISPDDVLLKIEHGGPHFGSVDHPQRWANIAHVTTGIAAEASKHLTDADAFIWIEGDLIWHIIAIERLLADLEDVPAVAPMVFANNTVRFYDTWGYRKGGRRFDPVPPYHPSIDGDITPIDSCGSCFVLGPNAFSELSAWDGYWPFHAGGRLWLEPLVAIGHP